MSRSKLLLTALSVLCLATALVAGTAHAAVPNVYMAMGDSFSSGETLGSYDPETDLAVSMLVNKCHRSSLAYPRLAAKDLGIRVTQHVACSGATIANLVTASKYDEEPQITTMTPVTDAVSLMIGANDMGFATLMIYCLHPPKGYTTCPKFFTHWGVDYFSIRMPVIRTGLRDALNQMKSKAPSARIFVLQYPQIFPKTIGIRGCNGYTATNAAYIRAKFSELNRAIAAAAKDAHVTLMPTEGAFLGHELCTRSPYATGTHPNWVGNRALATLLEARLR